MKIHIETQHLIIREVRAEDVHGFFDLDSDPEVHTYLGNKPIATLEEAAEVIQFIQKQYVDLGIGRWSVLEKETGEFIGWTGLKLMTDVVNKHVNYYDLGYRFLKKHWGKGYATEAAEASLKYAFETLQLDKVYAIAHHENKGSDHVLKKSGVVFVETFDYHGVPHGWYEIRN